MSFQSPSIIHRQRRLAAGSSRLFELCVKHSPKIALRDVTALGSSKLTPCICGVGFKPAAVSSVGAMSIDVASASERCGLTRFGQRIMIGVRKPPSYCDCFDRLVASPVCGSVIQ